MTNRDKLLLGATAGVGAAWLARQVIRSRRRIALDDRVVVITGASSGHGLVAARIAAQRGARLVIAARGAESLDAAASELARIGRGDVLAVATDVADREQCRRLVERAVGRHGRVDVLVNNAGVIQVGPMEAMTLEDFERAMATNFWGALHCTWAALPHMRARGFGRIANVVSVGGKMPVPHLMPYTTSKFALAGLTKALRIELAKDGILVTGVYPSTMRTGGHTHAWIKGDEPKEYAMFALSDTLPLVSTSAEHVARSMWRAVCDGDAEVGVGWQAQVRATLDALLPNWSADSTGLLAGMLPRAGGPDRAIRGEDIPGPLPELLTGLVPRSTRPRPGEGT